MKILLINTVYGTGSTGRICSHLYHYAEQYNFTPYIGYGRNSCSEINSYRIGNKLDFLAHVCSNFFRGNSGFASKNVTRKFLQWVDTVQPDLIHLHNIHGFYINIPMLFDYIKSHNIKVLWTFHDCWPFTGQCAHFDYIGCKRWKTQCQQCPQYRSAYPYSIFKDNSFNNYNNKKAAFCNVADMTIVTPSIWLSKLVRESFLGGYPIQVIPNGIDTSIFVPFATKGRNSSYLLGVANIWNDRKGLNFFLELASLIEPPLSIVLIGTSRRQKKKIEHLSKGKIQCLERTNNQQELARYYSNALAFVNPTLEDTFPTTNLESLACGTPVITFRTGGSPEALSPQCGIVVEDRSASALYRAVKELQNSSIISPESCRREALKYDCSLRYQEYMRLYQKILYKN